LKAGGFRSEDGRRFVVREVRLGDVDRLLKFANALVKEKRVNRDLGVGAFDKKVTRRFESGFVRGMVRSSKRKEAVGFAAIFEGEIIGFCTLRRREPADLRHAGVVGIAVREGYRGVGLGGRLMREVLLGAKRIGIWLVELEVMSINGAAIHLYEKLGFQRVGVIPGKVARDGRLLDIVVMYADLRNR
jgi:ribosomal protein S18 acetylase RimI-like enzyme